ncbi:MAG: hypothetical protein M1813_004692 [Trichoglossum hirsutum]|nr:MAG: hypothetical protein M1813_004692 [Trichoglossum hirsutum]
MQAHANLSLRLLRAYRCHLGGYLITRSADLPYGESLKDQALLYLARCVAAECEIRSAKLKAVILFVRELKLFPKKQGVTIRAACYSMLLSCLRDLRRIALGSLREDQVDCLTTFYGLSRYAAAAALDTRKEPLEALHVLEECRGLALSIQLAAVDDVPEEAGGGCLGVLGDYRRARQRLRVAVEQAAEYHERAALADEVLCLQEEIRPVGEYSWTLDEPLSMSQLCAAVSEDMAILVIVLADIQSYAIVAGGDAIESFRLPGLKEKELTEHHMAISPLLAGGIDSQGRSILYKRINEVLVIIWETTVEPVLVHLGICPDKAISRHARTKIYWIPTGVLGLYPLHTAGPASEHEGPASSSMDFVMSSYAPTLKFPAGEVLRPAQECSCGKRARAGASDGGVSRSCAGTEREHKERVQ